jgi:acyl carrier protein
MSPDEIQQKLTAVFRDVFDNDKLEISDSTTARDIEDWDSISHITLIAAVETTFGVSFNTRDVKNLANVGDFKRLIATRVK